MAAHFTKSELIELLEGRDDDALLQQACQIRNNAIGDGVYLRGLIELSNRCSRDCLYCGIRASNTLVERYTLTIKDIEHAARYAVEKNYGSVVMQSGEISTTSFDNFIVDCIHTINTVSNSNLGITLSLGEKSIETYKRWREAGAHRYLLRIESSSADLYAKIHPSGYSHAERLRAIDALRSTDYQVGTGVMIGLPFQTLENLADDLLFLRDADIDMCGMGPYIEHPDAPLAKYASNYSHDERILLTLRMIALLRLMMPEINIASTTALHALDPLGREKGIAAGANVVMPNITPTRDKYNYKLYSNKPFDDLKLENFNIKYSQRGDSAKYTNRRDASEPKEPGETLA